MVDVRTGGQIEMSERLGRPVRTDESDSLGRSTWSLLEDAIRADDTTAAIRLVDYVHESEVGPRHFFFTDWLYGNQSYVIEQFGPQGYEEMFRAEDGSGGGAAAGTVGGFPPALVRDVEALVRIITALAVAR